MMYFAIILALIGAYMLTLFFHNRRNIESLSYSKKDRKSRPYFKYTDEELETKIVIFRERLKKSFDTYELFENVKKHVSDITEAPNGVIQDEMFFKFWYFVFFDEHILSPDIRNEDAQIQNKNNLITAKIISKINTYEFAKLKEIRPDSYFFENSRKQIYDYFSNYKSICDEIFIRSFTNNPEGSFKHIALKKLEQYDKNISSLFNEDRQKMQDFIFYNEKMHKYGILSPDI